MVVLLLSKDYLFSSQLTGDVQRAEISLQQVASIERLEEEVQETAGDFAVVIDLSDFELDADLVNRLRAAARPPKAILAYGPHVATGKLTSAAQAGCDHVLTRGQAHRELGTLLASFF